MTRPSLLNTGTQIVLISIDDRLMKGRRAIQASIWCRGGGLGDSQMTLWIVQFLPDGRNDRAQTLAIQIGQDTKTFVNKIGSKSYCSPVAWLVWPLSSQSGKQFSIALCDKKGSLRAKVMSNPEHIYTQKRNNHANFTRQFTRAWKCLASIVTQVQIVSLLHSLHCLFASCINLHIYLDWTSKDWAIGQKLTSCHL